MIVMLMMTVMMLTEYDLKVSATDGAHVAFCRVIFTGDGYEDEK